MWSEGVPCSLLPHGEWDCSQGYSSPSPIYASDQLACGDQPLFPHVEKEGFGPSTCRLRAGCSSRLSYFPMVDEDQGAYP